MVAWVSASHITEAMRYFVVVMDHREKRSGLSEKGTVNKWRRTRNLQESLAVEIDASHVWMSLYTSLMKLMLTTTNHDLSISEQAKHIPLPKSTKEEFSEKLNAGIPVDSLTRYMHDFASCSIYNYYSHLWYLYLLDFVGSINYTSEKLLP